MEINQFILRLIIIMAPGIICSIIYNKLKGEKRTKDWETLLEIFLFSLITYVIYDVILKIVKCCGITDREIDALKTLITESELPSSLDLIFSTTIAIIVAFGFAAIYKYKLLSRIGRKIRVTARYGDEDVWEYFFHSPDVDWIFVRDYKNNLVYFGSLNAFSESNQKRELILTDVEVFTNDTCEELYKVRTVYLNLADFGFSIEIPSASADDK